MKQDRRAHPRLRERDSVAVKILASDVTPELVGRTFFCSTDDLSIEGLRFCVHTEVPLDAVLELRVAMQEPAAVFTHIGTVVYVKRVENENPFAIGVHITETKEGQLGDWVTTLTRKLAEVRKAAPPAD